jgi:hypothetical protein
MSYNEKCLRKVEWKINDLRVKMQTVDEKYLPRFVFEIERLKIRRVELQERIESDKQDALRSAEIAKVFRDEYNIKFAGGNSDFPE